MAKKPAPQTDKRNGHATIGAAADEEMAPKGYPTSDRYEAETAHTAETDDHTWINKPHRDK